MEGLTPEFISRYAQKLKMNSLFGRMGMDPELDDTVLTDEEFNNRLKSGETVKDFIHAP